jgi:putative ABC transport system permease protein
VIAVPVSWYFVDRWLSTFAYRMPMHWWVFAAAIAAVAAVTSVTVTARSRAAANENPVNAIQH